MKFRWLALSTFLLVTACGNHGVSCSGEASKRLVEEILIENYAKIFGQFAFVLDPTTLKPDLSAIATISSDDRSVNCSAQVRFTYQNRKAFEPKAQRNIDGMAALVGNRKTEISYEIRQTDDGQLMAEVKDFH